jgi:hypothetical protein
MASYKKYFDRVIRDHYPEKFDQLRAAIDAHFKSIAPDIRFAATSKNPIDRRLEVCSYFLAVFKTLDECGEPYETIQTISREIATEYVRPKNKLQAYMKRLPAKLSNTWLANRVIRILNKKFSQRDNPEGFVAKIITDKDETYGVGYGFDILECGICKLYKKHHYEKFASILCEFGEMTSALAGMKLVRTGTIANGAHTCDFRFKKEDS